MTDHQDRLLRPEVLALRAYEVEQPEQMIKLDANENPYPPPPGVMAQIADGIGGLALNRYPDPAAVGLRRLIARRTGWPIEGILLGNGSDELIALLLAACGGDGAKLLLPTPTFSMYRHLGLCFGWGVEEVPLSTWFDIEAEALCERAKRCRPRLTIFAYPNNPTGNCFTRETMERLLATLPGLVVVDEAYHDFAGQTFLPRLPALRNLIVLRTLSKIGLAALRVGILLASPGLVRELNKVRLPYNVSCFSQLAAEIVLRDPGYIEEQVRVLLEERRRLFEGLRRCKGVVPYPSDANFILFRTRQPSPEVFEALRGRGVLVRDLGGQPGLLHNCLRVTVGRPEENQAFLDALTGLS